MKLDQANEMTLQELFDYAIVKLVEQGKQCSAATFCLYADGKGNHCGIGWLLDEDNSKLMAARKTIRNLASSEFDACIPIAILHNLDAAEDFQDLHDFSGIDEIDKLLLALEDKGIDTNTNPAYQQWVDMTGKIKTGA